MYTKLDLNFIKANDLFTGGTLTKIKYNFRYRSPHSGNYKVCYNSGNIYSAPFINYIAEMPNKHHRHLTMDEFQKLLTTPIAENILNVVGICFYLLAK